MPIIQLTGQEDLTFHYFLKSVYLKEVDKDPVTGTVGDQNL